MSLDRQLVPFEQELEKVNRIANSLNVITISQLKGCLSQDSLKNALDIVQQRHPSLQSCISGYPDELRFCEKSDSPLSLQILEHQDQDFWQTVVLNELNQPINSSETLFRATLVVHTDHDRAYFITTIHHAISDGISNVKLHSEILSYCGNSQEEKKSLSPVSRLSVFPVVTDLLPDSHTGYRGKIRSILWLSKLIFKQFLLQPKTLEFEKYVPVRKRTCNVIYKQIEPRFTKILIERCRVEKTTVQGALCAAMLLAVTNRIKPKKSKKTSVACRTYVNLRQHLSPAISSENLGCFISAVITFHTISSQTQFWQLARDVKQQIKQGLDRGDIFNVLLMAKQILKAVLSKPNKAPLAVEVTNLGQLKIPAKYGSLELEKISFMPSQSLFGGVFLASVTTLTDRMMLNFSFSEPSLSKETVDELVENMIIHLLNACD
jgi:NRPS condensation-like uncharacterized protein